MTGSPKTRMLPDCWGHRGASSRFPENTLASFEAAIRDGAEGIESDVHVSADDVVVMFHDPALERTTDSTGDAFYGQRGLMFRQTETSPTFTGQIKERNWFGDGGMQHVRTRKEPRQPIPTFAETIELLMKPENHHVKFNVDVKVQNDPDRLFSLMNEIIAAQPDWQTALAPRILLGLWHPRFLDHAKARLPYCRRSYIGCSTDIARKYFWNDCDAFSIAFGALAAHDGQRFREECKNAGKNLMVWTVNKPAHMMEAVRWEVNAIITDATQIWLDLRSKLEVDYEGISSKYGRVFLWTTPKFYAPILLQKSIASRRYLEGVAGPFDSFVREKVEAGTVLGLLRMYTPFKTIMT